MGTRAIFAAVGLTAFLVTGCPPPSDPQSADAALRSDGGSVDAAAPLDAGSSTDGPLPDAANAPDASMAPTRLPGDVSMCPPGFRTALLAGQHAAFASGGQARSFHLLLPAASFTGPRPLLFAFHGTGGSGEGAIAGYDLAHWVSAGAIVVAPDSNENGAVWPVWDSSVLPGRPPHDNADLALFDDLIQCVAGHHEVDARRIYVAGHSAGGAMTNYVLARRSALLAGGIVASGPFDATQPEPPLAIDPMLVIVTWGGRNDIYTGTAGGTFVSNFAFEEQATMASQHWESRRGVHQIACRGDELRHNWLSPISGWMRDVLLAHPKGAATSPGESLPAVPPGAPVACSEDAAIYTPLVDVDCPTSPTAGCETYCQLFGDCLVENGTLNTVVVEQLVALGFADTPNVCTGCVSRCARDASGSAADATVLDCVASAAPTTMCGPGLAGAAIFGPLESCCRATPGSNLCRRYCDTFSRNALLGMIFPFCS